MKIRFLLIVMALLPLWAFGQDGGIKGRVVARDGRKPIPGAEVTLRIGERTLTEKTDGRGEFSFEGVETGVYDMQISSPDWTGIEMKVRVEKDKTDGKQYYAPVEKDLGIISLMPANFRSGEDLEAFELDFENADVQAYNPILTTSGDPFSDAAGFGWSAGRFRARGYDQSMQGVYLNGIYFNDAITGYTPWSLWTGLNRVTRHQDGSMGLAATDYGVGGISGYSNVDMRASTITPGFHASVVNASGQYRLRAMVTYASGLLDNGWSYAFSASTRQGGNDWVKGVYYNSWAYYASVEKRFGGDRHTLGLTFFATPGERAVQGAATQEVYDMVGSNYYNPNWGYQDGHDASDRRNARVRRNHEPVALLNYEFKINDNSRLSAAFAFRFGENAYSALEWGNAADPRPDYYRNLPSYYLREGTSGYNKDKANEAYEGWMTDWNIRQIDWQSMYNENWQRTFVNEGKEYWDGVNPEGRRKSEYIIEDRHTDQMDYNAKLQFTTLIENHSRVTAGYNFRYNRTEFYKKVKDLLGGDYYLDVNKYAEDTDYLSPTQLQSNLFTPNRLVEKGDKFGYDYYAHMRSQQIWAVYKLSLHSLEVTLAGEAGNTRMWREGRYMTGLFPTNSYGNSDKHDFWTYTAKAGVQYRIDGKHTLSANFARVQAAPYFQNVFLSPRTRNSSAKDVTTEKITSVELNYLLNTPALRVRASGYATWIKDRMDMISAYDDLYRQFSNLSITGIDQLYAGVELGVAVPLTPSLTLEGALSYGYFKYDSNPYLTQTVDNSDKIILDHERVYWKDYKIEGTPQTAATIGLNYSGPRSIFAGINLNFFDSQYLSMSPINRTDGAHENLTAEESRLMGHQEKFKEAFVLNANVGKMWNLGDGTTLGLNLQVNNILNDKEIKTGGWEQMRLYKEEQENGSSKYRRFDSKYYYMFGTTYYLQLYIRF